VSSKVWGWKGRRVEGGDGKRWKKLEEVGRRLSVGVVSSLSNSLGG